MTTDCHPNQVQSKPAPIITCPSRRIHSWALRPTATSVVHLSFGIAFFIVNDDEVILNAEEQAEEGREEDNTESENAQIRIGNHGFFFLKKPSDLLTEKALEILQQWILSPHACRDLFGDMHESVQCVCGRVGKNCGRCSSTLFLATRDAKGKNCGRFSFLTRDCPVTG